MLIFILKLYYDNILDDKIYSNIILIEANLLPILGWL